MSSSQHSPRTEAKTAMPYINADFCARCLTVCIACTFALASDAAQPAPEPSQPQAVEAPAVSDPYSLEDLGVTVLLPDDTVVDTQFVPGGRTKAVLKAPDNTWVVQIFNAVSSNTTLTISEVLDNFEEQRRSGLRAYQNANPNWFRGANPKFFTEDDRGRSPLVVSGRLDPEQLTIGGQPAGRFYCDTPLIEPNIATGYTVFRRTPGTFIIFQLDCLDKSFARSRQVYETIVASVTFEDPEQTNAERATALLAGKRFLESVSNEDIEAVLSDEPAFYRFYKPAPTGLPSDATEIGWQRVQMRRGQRGELEPGKPKSNWTAADREVGFLVRIDGEFTFGRNQIEMYAAYFLDRERTNEAISTMTRNRVNGELVAERVVTVIRRDRMMTLSSVQTASPAETRDWSVPEEYISRVELELLPRLVALKTPADSPTEFDFGYFHFNVENQRLQLRRDKFSNLNLVKGWEYRSEPGPRIKAVEATLDTDGNLIRRELADGTVMESIEPERLRELQSSAPTNR